MENLVYREFIREVALGPDASICTKGAWLPADLKWVREKEENGVRYWTIFPLEDLEEKYKDIFSAKGGGPGIGAIHTFSFDTIERYALMYLDHLVEDEILNHMILRNPDGFFGLPHGLNGNQVLQTYGISDQFYIQVTAGPDGPWKKFFYVHPSSSSFDRLKILEFSRYEWECNWSWRYLEGVALDFLRGSEGSPVYRVNYRKGRETWNYLKSRLMDLDNPQAIPQLLEEEYKADLLSYGKRFYLLNANFTF